MPCPDSAVALEADKLIDGGGVFLIYSTTDFIADCAEDAGHRGALSVALASLWNRTGVGIFR
jgi:hypothetical protein